VEITVVMARTAPVVNQAEVVAAGGNLRLVDGTIADAGRVAKELAESTGAFLAATFSEPYRLEGKKAAWLEVFDALGADGSMSFPRTLVMPVGGGVGAIAAAKAAEEVAALGWADGESPRLIGVQSDECAPLVRAFEQGVNEVAPWDDDPRTVAAGLRVPSPAEGTLVLRCIRESRGDMVAVREDDIVGAMRDLAATEGVFAGPEGATTVLAGERLAREHSLEGPVVLYNTSSAAKYVDLLT
jgi:threonine synthase